LGRNKEKIMPKLNPIINPIIEPIEEPLEVEVPYIIKKEVQNGAPSCQSTKGCIIIYWSDGTITKQ
jgi:hypothetical protein